jgi:hypothetical protein
MDTYRSLKWKRKVKDSDTVYDGRVKRVELLPAKLTIDEDKSSTNLRPMKITLEHKREGLGESDIEYNHATGESAGISKPEDIEYLKNLKAVINGGKIEIEMDFEAEILDPGDGYEKYFPIWEDYQKKVMEFIGRLTNILED